MVASVEMFNRRYDYRGAVRREQGSDGVEELFFIFYKRLLRFSGLLISPDASGVEPELPGDRPALLGTGSQGLIRKDPTRK